MKIAVDSNILVRSVVRDDAAQYEAATGIMARAEIVAVGVLSLCELVWVLRRVYRFQLADISKAIRILITAENVETDFPAVEAGLAMLDAGGDFADGVIAYEGRWLGGETFVSFDRHAVEMLKAQGQPAKLL
jgi:predicted nucleic-acid-binding protein